MNALSPAPYLRVANVNLRSTFACPECEKGFIAEEGVVYPATYQSDGEVKFGLLTFCGTACLLRCHGLEVGHA
jgi:hypothetical protein